MKNSSARLIAFYLPQFHPIPENDEFWGQGFTEWTNVASARPLYRGHEQPKIPGGLGFYDLRLSETRVAQAELARRHGIEGFCYWHYWFAGRRVLQRPFEEVLSSGEPDFPFCLAWANESWTGIWHGVPNKVLIEQTYPGPEDHAAHFDSILPAITDPRYILVDGKPLILVYRPIDFPDARAFCAQWRELAKRSGLPGLHLVGFGFPDWDPTEWGFDGSVLHGPRFSKNIFAFGRNQLRALIGRPRIYSYRKHLSYCFPQHLASPLDYPVALPNWDNTPRSGRRGVVFEGSTPELFRQHLREAIDRVADRPEDHRIVFVKSWNEWAEGNFLEPDQKWGQAFLKVVYDEVST